jgi:hypothetical protein
MNKKKERKKLLRIVLTGSLEISYMQLKRERGKDVLY